MRVWEQATGHCVGVLEGHSASVISLVTTGSSVLSAADDGTIRRWPLNENARDHSWHCLQVVEAHSGRISSLQPMGRHLWSCSADRTIKIWQNSNLEPLKTIQAHDSYVNGICKVRHTETREVWSYSLGDGKVKKWKMEEVIEEDTSEALQRLQAVSAGVIQHAQSLSDRLIQCQEEKRVLSEKLEKVSTEFKHEMDRMLRDLGLKTLEIDRLRRELGEVRACYERLLKEEADLRQQHGHLSEEHTKTVGELTALQSAHAKLMALHEETLAQLNGMTADRNQLRSSLSEVTAENAGLQKSNKALLERVDELEKLLASTRLHGSAADAELQDLRQQLSSTTAERDSLRRELNATKDQLQRSQAELTEVRADRDHWRERCLTAESEIKRLQDAVSALQAENEELRYRMSQLDVFKLDVIARELKAIDTRLGACREHARSFATIGMKKISNFQERELVKTFSEDTAEEIGDCRGIVKDVIQNCLSEIQKMHVGAALLDPHAGKIC